MPEIARSTRTAACVCIYLKDKMRVVLTVAILTYVLNEVQNLPAAEDGRKMGQR